MRIEIIDNNYHPDVDEIAKEIWGMEADVQLELMNSLSSIGKPFAIAMQMQAMKDEKDEYPSLYADACKFVAQLNEYLNGE